MTAAQTAELAEVFCRACRTGDMPLVAKLVDVGADVNHGRPSFHDEPPLIYAILGGSLAMVRLLLQRGADVNAISALDERTPLHYTAMRGHFEMTNLLLSAGAAPSLEARAGCGSTPWQLALAAGHGKLARALLSERDAERSLAAGRAPLLERAGLGVGTRGYCNLAALLALLGACAFLEVLQPLRDAALLGPKMLGMLVGGGGDAQ